MDDQLERLIRLQETDQQIAKLKAEIDRVEPAVEEARSHLKGAERALEEGRATVESSRKQRRDAERDLDAQIDKIRKFEDQQGKVKTNKEYQALMGELEALKREKTAIEDRILSLMESVTETEKIIVPLQAEVAREKAEFAKREAALRAEEARLKGELARADKVRDGIVPGVAPEHLLQYQRLLKLRGTAVAEARDEICLGCRVGLPPQKFVEVMRNDSVTNCNHCQRILYFRRDSPPPAAAATADADPPGAVEA